MLTKEASRFGELAAGDVSLCRGQTALIGHY